MNKKTNSQNKIIKYFGMETFRKDKYKSFKCNVCGKDFTTSQRLEIHRIIHSGEKPFKCDICDKAFNNKSNSYRHFKNNHTDKKPFKCDVCEKRFNRSDNLKVHKRIHI